MARTTSPETDLIGEDVLVLWRPVAVGNSDLSDPVPCFDAALSIIGFGTTAEVPAPGGGFYSAPNGFIRRWTTPTKYVDGSGIEYWGVRTQPLPANLDGTDEPGDPGYRALPIEGTAYRIAGKIDGAPFSFTFEIDAAADYAPEYEDGAIPVEVIAVDGTSFVGTPSSRFAASIDAVISITAGTGGGTVDHPSAGTYVINFPASLDDLDPPGSTIDAGGQRITNVADPTTDADAVNRSYLNGSILEALSGLSWKESCRVATTANIDLSSAPGTIDGTVLNPAHSASARRVLVKDQTAQEENGIYEWVDVGLPMVRTADLDSALDFRGASVFVYAGTANNDTQWAQTTNAVTVGVTAVVWQQVGGTTTYSAGTGLDLAGTTFSVEPAGIVASHIGFKLDDVPAPDAAVPMGGQRLTGLGNPTDGADAVSVNWVKDNAVQSSNLPNAKGDLAVATAADTFARLAVGGNDRVLQADSAQSTGVKWGRKISSGTSAPSSPSTGDIWFDTTP